MTAETQNTPYDGRRAKIVAADHPHYNAIAKCLRAEKTAVGWGMIFKNVETDEEFFVFDGKEVKWVD